MDPSLSAFLFRVNVYFGAFAQRRAARCSYVVGGRLPKTEPDATKVRRRSPGRKGGLGVWDFVMGHSSMVGGREEAQAIHGRRLTTGRPTTDD